ncbi:metalloregulator ArsR/SmtB family transcription factor [Fictibacillus sp. WQ 8-8]|uniref:ArsR/SmtB family transcription factor n=1 Tax=unclassified Fictibacillus TaxID=2644029 RepID=UPI0007838289|nr:MULTISPECIES: metalloregulator ArsR/SmtB family transcription factor [unclassified Fictibacillus]MCQ6268626.1 metalloregulator ArsR/SmtB family transcription factor [Fictibacillus sp. WQ 8-8]UZJ78533.1 metalloregulator ArsR/SmtB family transcription factor [Fictibacillus sp. KU28468]SFE68885.1 transcriptional regulator, ArsR family [Bacillus sp. OV194]
MSANINATLSALAEPKRLQMIELLREGPLTVGEIAERLGLLQPQTSKHLRVLNQAGFVEVHAIANRRIYKLSQQPFKDLNKWLVSFQNVWEGRLDRLDDYLLKMQEKTDEP